MYWTIFWGLLCVAYVIITFVKINQDGYDNAQMIQTISGFVAILTILAIHLYRSNLSVYFYWNRFKNWLRNYPSKWRLDVRYEGVFGNSVIDKISAYIIRLNGEKIPAKIFSKTINSIYFSVYDTLNFHLDYQPRSFNDFDNDLIDISLSPFEIGSNDSQKKLNTEIVPILNKLQELLKPENTSYVLNITFLRNNPFYAIFISHLRPSQIDSFTVNLQLDSYSKGNKKDFVTVNKENLVVNANDIHSLKELSKDFIYLSTNVKQYLRV